jgi:hypothetical protein
VIVYIVISKIQLYCAPIRTPQCNGAQTNSLSL